MNKTHHQTGSVSNRCTFGRLSRRFVMRHNYLTPKKVNSPPDYYYCIDRSKAVEPPLLADILKSQMEIAILFFFYWIFVTNSEAYSASEVLSVCFRLVS